MCYILQIFLSENILITSVNMDRMELKNVNTEADDDSSYNEPMDSEKATMSRSETLRPLSVFYIFVCL